MVLAFLLHKYFPYGGLQRDFLRIALNCQVRGHHIRVYTFSWQGTHPQNFEIILVPKKYKTNHANSSHFFNWVQTHLASHPVDKVIGFNKMPGLDIYYAADVCYEDLAQRESKLFYKMTPRYRHYSSFERSVFDPKGKTLILALTPKQIHSFQHYYQTPNFRFFLLPPGIETNRKYTQETKGVRLDFRYAYQINNKLLILQIGSDFYRKGVDRSLMAVASLPLPIRNNILFFVVGQDNPRKYLKLAHSLGIQKQVKFFSGRSDIPHFLFSADLLIHPARTEAAGIVLVEAIAAGLPILATEICGYAFHIKRANAGMIIEEPFTQKTFNKQLTYLLEDPNHLKKLSYNALDYANKYDLYSLADKAADIILDESNITTTYPETTI